MVKMPGKSNKPPRSRKRSPANSTETSIQSLADLEQESLHNEELSRSLNNNNNNNPVVSRLPESQASHYPPAYRDDGGAGNMAMGGYPQQMSTTQHHGQNGMGMMGSSPAPPIQFHPPSKPVVENGYNHVGSLVEKDIFNRTLEQNAQIILQVNQAMADNRVDVIGDLMNQLGKNINFLSAAAEATPHPSSAMASSGENVGTSHGPSRITQNMQSPMPVRPHSQATPPHVSPPPGMPQQQQNFQIPPNGQQYGQQPPVGYPPNYGAGQTAQARPNPVYSPLTQSTHGPGYSPKSPNGPFPQQTANGFPPSRPPYHQGNMQQTFQTQQQQMQQPQPSTSNSMPPPQNYPYVGQPRGVPSYGPGPGYGSYQPQEQPTGDPNFTSMPPPQMQPKRSSSSGHRNAVPQGAPQGPIPDQRQMMYQQRPYMDPYGQQQGPQGPQQHYGPGPPHHQMMAHPSSVPSGQYHMQQQQQHQQAQFRSPAPPGSAYASPSPGGAGS